MKLKIVVIFFFASFASLAQYDGPFKRSSRDFEKKYANYLEDGEVAVKTWYHYMVSQKGDEYILRQFEPEVGNLFSETHFSDKKLRNKSGPYKEMASNGKSYRLGQYRNDERDGYWTSYYLSGVVKDSIYFEDGKVNGLQKYWYENGSIKYLKFFDLGRKWGVHTEFWENGEPKLIENYKDNELDGDYIKKDSLGSKTTHWKYANGEIIDSVVGNPRNEEMPTPLFSGCEEFIGEKYSNCQQRAMYLHISNNVNYPRIEEKYGVGGKVFVKFVIEVDGKIGEVEVLKGLSNALNDESVRVLMSMGKWKPGKQNGKPVRVFFTIPIVYQSGYQSAH